MHLSEFSVCESFVTNHPWTTLGDLTRFIMLPRKWKWLSASSLNIKMWASKVLPAVNSECEQRDVCACVFSVWWFQFSFHSEGKHALLFLYCKGTQHCYFLWIVTIFFIQIHQSWARYISLCPTLSCSTLCLLSSTYIYSCLVTIYISVSEPLTMVVFMWQVTLC